jgi:uncharacterized membrane-anchored protein YhcB (DUF1043 family)
MQLHTTEKLSPGQLAQAESLVTHGATGGPIMQASARAAINTLKAKVDEQQGAILCQSHSSRPDGVSLLDSMTHSYEKETGRKSTIPPAVVSKLEARQKLASLRSETREVKNALRPTAPAKPAATSKGRTGAQFLTLSDTEASSINKTCCFADRSGELRTELTAALNAMPAGAERSKFYKRFKGAFQAASGLIVSK